MKTCKKHGPLEDKFWGKRIKYKERVYYNCKLCAQEHRKKPEVIIRRRIAYKRWRDKNKNRKKEISRKYSCSDKGQNTIKKYFSSERGKAANKRKNKRTVLEAKNSYIKNILRKSYNIPVELIPEVVLECHRLLLLFKRKIKEEKKNVNK